MSRYNCDGYAYGYDQPLCEYFLQRTGKTTKEIVGSLGSKPGTAGNFLEAVKKLGIKIPEEHMQAAMMDLPF
ncbi:hypothetical protein EBZ39_19590 [bacterium]|nr:hypothetical protein [bacterium]